MHRVDVELIHTNRVGNTGLKSNSRSSRLIVEIEKRWRVETAKIKTELSDRVEQELANCHEVFLSNRLGELQIKFFNNDLNYRKRLELLTSGVKRNEASRDVFDQLSLGQLRHRDRGFEPDSENR